jgi:hypothetical protein
MRRRLIGCSRRNFPINPWRRAVGRPLKSGFLGREPEEWFFCVMPSLQA